MSQFLHKPNHDVKKNAENFVRKLTPKMVGTRTTNTNSKIMVSGGTSS